MSEGKELVELSLGQKSTYLHALVAIHLKKMFSCQDRVDPKGAEYHRGVTEALYLALDVLVGEVTEDQYKSTLALGGVARGLK